MSIESFRRAAAGYMDAAMTVGDPDQQAQLFDAAVYWHTLALEAEAQRSSSPETRRDAEPVRKAA